MYLRLLTVLVFMTMGQTLFAQVVINEVLSLNTSGITDEDLDHTDWIELYNNSNQPVNLGGYYLKDDLEDSTGWVFPDVELPGKGYLLVFASGKDRKTFALNYRTIITQGDEWQYLTPNGTFPDNAWRMPGFDASGWKTGASGFGYGDGDDQTLINPLQSIFIRKEFTIDNLDELQDILLNVDYDDGFVAFINGEPVAMENVYLTDDYNQAQFSGSDHEAQLYNGGTPNAYKLNPSDLNLNQGENMLAIQGYNVSTSSSDFSLIPFLTLGSTAYGYSDVADFIHVGEGGLHTNFKIKNEGEGLYLYDGNQEIADSLWVVALPANKSYGRYPDGAASWKYFNIPTPGEANKNPSDEIRYDSIAFSKPAGFYQSTITVGLTPTHDDLAIRYTTDGSDPTLGSQAYTKAITITNSTVLRVAGFLYGQRSTEIFTKSYFINTNHTLPVFSISTDPYNLWDYNYGIYELGPNAESSNPNFGANFWQDWEREVHLELFDEDKTEQLDQNAGVKITGAWSRANAQKSLALFARSAYGDGSFSAKLFHDLPFDKYEAFMLRNSGNDWGYSMLRDGLVSELAKPLDIDRLAFQPSVVYINGEYWGIQNLREKPNEHYFESHYDVDEDELNLLEANNGVITGSSASYLSLLNFLNQKSLATEGNYTEVKNQLDVNEFIDYELIEIYIQNGDWPGNNIKYWRSNQLSSKWRWLLYDTDFGFDIWNGSTYREDGIAYATDPNNSSWPNPMWSTLLLRKMLVSPDFKVQFVNRMADLLNTYLSADTVLSKLDSLKTLMEPEIYDHRDRWNQNSNWDGQLELIRRFAQNRPMYTRDDFANYFGLENYTVSLSVSGVDAGRIKVNTVVPGSYPFKGHYFGGVPLKFTALPNPGYKFAGWENASNSSEASITLNLQNNIKLNAVFEPISGNEQANIVINEINYRSTDDYDMGDWLELYNDGDFTVNLSGYKISDASNSAGYIFPEGMVLYPDAYLVICEDLDKFKKVYPGLTNVVGSLQYGLSRKGDEISLLDDQNNLIDQVKYETSNPWPVQPFETAATLELKNPNLDNNLYTSWEAGPLGGTPGAPNSTKTSSEELFVNANDVTCFPIRFKDYTTLRFQTTGEEAYQVKIFDVQGRLRNELSGELPGDGAYYLDIFTEQKDYPKGIYLVNVQTGRTVKTIKVVKL